ncbi:unnamed protein product [Malus baccata var. baccata]
MTKRQANGQLLPKRWKTQLQPLTKCWAICGSSSAGLPNQAIGARLQHQNKLPRHKLKQIRAIISVLIGKSSSDNGGKSMLVLWKGIETQRISVMGNRAIHYQLVSTPRIIPSFSEIMFDFRFTGVELKTSGCFFLLLRDASRRFSEKCIPQEVPDCVYER